ncbi:MAG: pyridoxine 5'-phosphate synthase [Alphaproteobacteria bacterium]|nr:pyridoxine 5'-phosphate synthase [Alphaproteobacteria bacterium]
MPSLLSCNLDKIALLRNSRDGFGPDLGEAARLCLDSGARGLTLHPRVDRRHALLSDLHDFSALIRNYPGCEFNIEGDLRADLLERIDELEPEQFTVVPGDRGEKTSSRGWRHGDDQAGLVAYIKRKPSKTRVSVFVDPTVESVQQAVDAGAGAAEFYTGHYALSKARYDKEPSKDSLRLDYETRCARLVMAAEFARSQGLRINAGHDLNLDNLGQLVRLIRPEEVSIGHALISDALNIGLPQAIHSYCRILQTS